MNDVNGEAEGGEYVIFVKRTRGRPPRSLDSWLTLGLASGADNLTTRSLDCLRPTAPLIRQGMPPGPSFLLSHPPALHLGRANSRAHSRRALVGQLDIGGR